MGKGRKQFLVLNAPKNNLQTPGKDEQLAREVIKNPMTTVTKLQSSLAEMGEQQSLQHFTNLGFMRDRGQTEVTPEKKAHV